MEIPHWIEYGEHLLQDAGILGALWFSGRSSRKDEQSRKTSNLYSLTQNYWEIWKPYFDTPRLRRVLKRNIDLIQNPITEDERLFINMLILHLESSHRAIKAGMLNPIPGLPQDIKQFFSQPIPKGVWEESKSLRSQDFIDYVESSRGGESRIIGRN